MLSSCLDGKHEEAALACWAYLVLGAHFSGLGDFAPGGLLGPRYGHVWLLYPLENEPVGAEEGEGGAGSFQLASRSENVKLFTGLWGFNHVLFPSWFKTQLKTRSGVLPCGLPTLDWV